MMILRTLLRSPKHGYDIAETIQQNSQDVLQIEEGALYQALHRMEIRGLLDSEWGLSATKRRAKFYRLTKAGHKQLASESLRWNRLSSAVSRVMGTA